MMCPQEDINRYLEDTKELFKNNKYIISYNDNRRENYQLIMDYVISEYDKKMILLSITSDNFVKRESNTKEKYHNEIMYVFGKNVDLMKICAIKIKYQENKRTEKRMVCYNRKNKRKWRKQ